MSDENDTPTPAPEPPPAPAEAPSAASAAEPQAAELVAEPPAPPEVTPEAAAEQPTPHHAPPDESSAVAPAEEPPAAVAPAEEQPAAVAAAEEPPAEAAPEAPPPPPESKKKWYVVKVTSNREDSIKAAIERRVRIEGLEEFFGQIAIPVEHVTQVKKVTETKNGEKFTKQKNVVKAHKKYPGYLFAEVEFNENMLYLFRETSGVGDFVGAGLNRAPVPMTDREVQAMLYGLSEKDPGKGGGKKVIKLEFEKGDKVRIREGAFANMEGEVKVITTPKEKDETPKVTVEVTIFGRGVPVDLDYWQVDKV